MVTVEGRRPEQGAPAWRMLRSVLLVAADPMEFGGLRGRIGRAVQLQWPVDYSAWAELHGRRWLLLANGAGAARARAAAEVAREREPVEVLVSPGFCGGLSRDLQPGDIFVATEVRSADGAACYPSGIPRTDGKYACGPLISVDRVIGTAEEKARLRESGADAVEMEAAGVAECALRWNLPFYCVRSVTDAAGESFSMDLNKARDEAGRIRPWRVAAGGLRSPRKGIPELWRLRERCALASERLGEFLTGCSF